MVSLQLAAVLLSVSGIGETVLLDFSAPWCGPCRSMESTVDKLGALGYPVRKVNVDQERQLAAQYHVTSIPCFVLVVEGREVDRIVGATTLGQLEGLLAKARVNRPEATLTEARAQSPGLPLSAGGLASRSSGAAPISAPAAARRGPTANAKTESALNLLSTPSAPANSNNVAQLLAASVRLTIEDPKGISYGSGTLIDSRNGEALVLTCGHLFRESQGQGKITVDLFGPGGPKKLPGQLIGYDLKRDVGLIGVRTGGPVAVARLAAKGNVVHRGDKVVTIGCNNGGEPSVLETNVLAVDKFLGPANVQVAGEPVQGRSGGGLFSADGLVIGVCNAADPADKAGLYAAGPTIREQLDQAGLMEIYSGAESPAPAKAAPAGGGIARITATAPAGPVANGTVPPMPSRMPDADLAAVASGSAAAASPAPVAGDRANPAARARVLNANERATLEEIRRMSDGAEVICIVRPLSNPQAQSQIIVLDRASQAFMEQLATERTTQPSRNLTSLRK